MAPSDLDALLDMGFERQKAEFAVKQSGGLQGAIDWLDQNQDKTIEEINEEANSGDTNEPPDLKPGEEARSLICNDCGKRFRSNAQAEFHASKTEHINFSESTEEIAPLTEEEKAAKLAELRERMAAKRAVMSAQDKIDQKRNEEIRRKSTKEVSDAKEELAKKEQIKEAQAKRREKLQEVEAKKRIQAKIAEDKEERRLKAEREKAARLNTLPAEPSVSNTPASAHISAPISKPASAFTEARLRLQTPNGTIQKNFPAETTLFEVAQSLEHESGLQVQTFTSNYPKKTWDATDFGMTLREAGLVPSAALVVK